MFHVGEGFAAGLRTNMFMMLARGAAHKKWGRGREKRCLSETRSQAEAASSSSYLFLRVGRARFSGMPFGNVGPRIFQTVCRTVLEFENLE